MHEADRHSLPARHWMEPPAPYPAVSPIQATVEGAQNSQIDYGRLFRRYILLAVLLMILGGIGGVFSVALTAPVYQASALVEVRPAGTSVLKLQATPDYGEGLAELATESRIIESNSFLRQVLQRLQLNQITPPPDQSGFFPKLRQILKLNKSEEIPPALDVEGLATERGPRMLVMAVRTLKAQPVTGTHLLEISCDSTNPQFAANFLNVLIDEYIQHNYQTRMETLRTATQWISGQLEEAKARVTEADRHLAEFMRDSGGAIGTTDNGGPESKLRGLQTRLATAQADLLQKQARYETVKKTAPESLANVIDDPDVRQFQARIADLRRQEASLLLTVTPEHPKVKDIEAQIANLQASQDKQVNAAVKRIDSEYAAAQRDQDLLQASYSTVARQVANQVGKEAQFDNLKKQSDSAKEAYQALLVQANQADVASSLPVTNIQPIDRAVPPEKPGKPKPLVNIGAGLMAGLALCGGIAFLREKMDQRVGSPDHARLWFNLPQLGVIPSVQEDRSARHLLQKGSAVESETNDILISSGPTDGAASPLVSSGNPLLAESFRITLASLMRETTSHHRPQVILVTSPGPGEGKTTIASNLGVAIAETGRRVIVIDADFRRPRAHKVFGLPNTYGLFDLLNEEAPVTTYRREALGLKTTVPNLLVLPNGTQSQNIPKALYSSRLRDLVQRLRQDFEMILIDAPPALYLADARVLSVLADGVVLVLRAGMTDKDSAAEVLDFLSADRTVVLGTVLNDWKPSKAQAKKRHYYDLYSSNDRP